MQSWQNFQQKYSLPKTLDGRFFWETQMNIVDGNFLEYFRNIRIRAFISVLAKGT